MKVYIIEPIDRCGEAVKDQSNFKELMASKFTAEAPVMAFFPALAYGVRGKVNQEDITFLQDLNWHALTESDAVALIYKPGVESWGSPVELEQARAAGKRLFVLLPIDRPVDLLPFYLRSALVDAVVVHGWPELLDALIAYSGETT
jgi:hypothetical protein